MSLNFELARHNMIEQQVRPWDVLDARVLEVFAKVRREDYVPAPYRSLAFADLSLPLGFDEVMMKPVVEGRMLQALALTPSDQVLEIGTGSGFITACLAKLAASVISLELRADFAAQASALLHATGVYNATIEVCEALLHYQAPQQFDAIAVTGAVFQLPPNLREWVKPNGGRLFAIVGESPAMQAKLFTRLDEQHWSEENLFETDLPYLTHAAPPKRFVL